MFLVVAPLGLLAGIGSIFFARSVADVLDWKEGGEYQTEVGFFNMAIGVSGIVAAAGEWHIEGQLAVVMVYILYLSQALCFHISNMLKKKDFTQDRYFIIGMMVFLVVFLLVFLLHGFDVF